MKQARFILWIIALLLTVSPSSAKLFFMTRGAQGPLPPRTITGITPSSNTFVAQTGNAGTPIGTFAAGVSAGTFGGTFALSTGGACTSSANNALFTVASNGAFSIGSGDITAAGTYQICVVATDPLFSNNPYKQTITLTGTAAVGCSCGSGGTPAVCVSGTSFTANSSVPISWVCGPSDVGAYIGLPNMIATAQAGQYDKGAGNGIYGILTRGASSGSGTIPAPNAKVDRDTQWYASLQVSSGAQVAASSLFTVPKTIDPPAPTASLPSALAADPFTPLHTNTVCASGCDYTNLGDATSNSSANHWDYVKFTISAGDYQFPALGLPSSSQYPVHFWIHGISSDGKTFPHIFGTPPTQSGVFATGNANPGTGYELTLDNLELGYWNSYKVTIPGDSTKWTLRNVYVHDGLDGLESGNNWPAVYNIYNSVFSRNGGGGGPDHNVYIGNGGIVDGNGNPSGNGGNTINVVNSVFEQPNIGHSFKHRAANVTFTCSALIANADTVYLGTGDYDVDFGNMTINKSLLFQGTGGGSGWNHQNGWTHGKFAGDNETGKFLSPPLYNLVVTGSNMVNDQNNYTFWPILIAQRFTGPNPVPATWSGNNFVWVGNNYRDLSNNGTTPGGEVTTGGLGNIADVNLDATNHDYVSWAAAGFSVASNAEPYGWRDLLPLMPSACTDPVGLVKIPAS